MKDDGDGVDNRKMCLASEDVTSGFEIHFIIYVYFLYVSLIKTNNYCYSLITVLPSAEKMIVFTFVSVSYHNVS